MDPPTPKPDSLNAAREIAFMAFDEAWSDDHKRERASFEGVRQAYWWAAFEAALDYMVGQRTDLDALRAERDALEPHMQVQGDCQRNAFLGDCAECGQYGRLSDRIMELEIQRLEGR